MKIYAAYGSNMNLAQMKKRCPKAQVIGKGQLHGYTLTFRGGGYANVEISGQGSVPIVLWDITTECERELDQYEEYPRLYTKKVVTITTADEEQVAMLYVMTKKYASKSILPSEDYFAIIRQGYLDNGINIEPLLQTLNFTKAELMKG